MNATPGSAAADQASPAAVLDPARLAALRATGLLDSPPEPGFDRLTRLAARLLDVPMALVSLVDQHRQFFKSSVGLAEPLATCRETPLSHSYCKHAVGTTAPLVIEDARQDPLVCDSPALHEFGVIAYLGIPVMTPDCQLIGTLCVFDTRPRRWTPEQISIMEDLAASVTSEVGLRYAAVGALRVSEARVRQQHAELEQIYRCAPVGLCALDRDFRYLRINDVLADMNGLPAAAHLGRTVREVLPGLADTLEPIQRRVLDTGEPVLDIEIRGTTPKAPQDEHVWRVSCYPTRGDAGVLTGLGWVVKDVTERKQVEEALHAATVEAERANNAKSRFLAAASHDLRQPMAALSLYVGVLTGRVGPELTALVGHIHDCVGSLSALLKDLLDLSKLDAGVVTPHPSDFSAVELLNRVVSAHAPPARLKGLDLRWRPCPLTLHIDAVLLERLLGNLVSNAIRYTERGGVLLGCRRRQGKVWLEVWDTGIGIPPDKIGVVFEEFRQLHNDERGQGKGSGLGLAIVARTAALLGLQIRVHSRPGRGSCFAVELPVVSAVASSPAEAGAARPMSIALVEDQAVVRLALTCALEAVGHSVVAAASGRELLARLQGHAPPDIVISDYRLSAGETGFDVIAATRAACGAALAAIIVTGDTDPALMRRMVEHGVLVLHKPIELAELQTAIDQLLTR